MDIPGSNSSSIIAYITMSETGAKILRIVGDIDLSTSTKFKQALDSSIADYSGRLIIDLSEVTFMDSSGIHALAEAARSLYSRGGSITLRNPAHSIHRILEISGLLSHFDFIE